MRLGYISQNTPRDVPPARLAAELEARGFESLWVGEHPQIPVAARDSPLAPMLGPLKRKYDPLIVLAVAAEATSRLVVGTAVALPLEHELFTFAKQVATVDQLSGGRLVLGVGVGLRVEFEVATRRPWADRYRLLGEMVAAMQVLWADDEPEFHGEFFDFEPV